MTDIWGPSYQTSRDGFKYYISFVDAFSTYTWIYFLRTKNEAFKAFLSFKQTVEKLLGQSILRLQTDGGGEFRSFIPYLKSNDIEHRMTCPHTSQQNGLVERKHRHIVETSLALLSHSSLKLEFWDDAFSTAVYLINRLPTQVHQQISSLEKIFGSKPNYSFLKTFGCLCYPSLRSYNKHKVDPRSIPCLFLGYSLIHKGYKCLSNTGRLYISRHVLFDESKFPTSDFLQSNQPTSNTYPTPDLLPIVQTS